MSRSEIQELTQAKQLMEEGRIEEAHQIVLGLENKENLTAKELFSCKLLKANFLYKSRKYSEAIIYTDQLLQESQKQGDLLIFLDILMIQSLSHTMLGNVSKSEDLIKKADDLFKKIKGTSIIDLRERESFLVRIKANICTWKGEIHRSLELNKEAFELAEDSKDRELTSASLINIAEKYQFLGDYDNAKLYAERAIEIQYQPWLIYMLGSMIDILLDKGDIEEANHYFQQVSEIREKDKSKINDIFYRYYKALLLKTSLRSKNRVKSEKLLKQIIDDEDVSGGIKSFEAQGRIFAIINLCDLLLIELRITNYPEIIDEIQPYIQKLLDFAEQQQSYWILCETHLLQAKLSLLTFDIKKAKRFLTQAQQIAERFAFTQLSTKIAEENNDLLKREDLWEKLKREGAPMADRVELARLDEQIEGMVRNPTILTAYVREEKVAISRETKICLVCRGKVLGFTYICECGAIYCENCAKALINLENICWVCDIPIDSLKPVKPYKGEVEGENVIIKGKKE
ncbi:hypothetical protein LCGC14_2263870 [marine sediment metagenome]|uniref:Uncharacterized protein n=1 Tax=marine sediment metagenome TaxID=412755 RepID=A0A0F9FTX3_9ZZZZ